MKKFVIPLFYSFGILLFSYFSIAVAETGEMKSSNPPTILKHLRTLFSLPPRAISPSGVPLPEGTEIKSKFTWEKVKGANTYEIWVPTTKTPPQIRTFKNANLDCTEHECTTKDEIELSSREGQWAVLAHDGSKKSEWGKAFFGTRAEGDKFARCIKPAEKIREQGKSIDVLYKKKEISAQEIEDVLTYEVEPGDLPFFRNEWSGFTTGEWTVGLAALAQIIKYDFAKKKAGFNNGLGAGASFRFYRDVRVPLRISKTGKVPISRVNSGCRASTFRLRDDTDLPDAAPVFSVTPVIFASQIIGEDNLRVEPAVMLGFFEDLINVGAGFNLSGKDGDVGDVFLLFSVGAGFNF